MELRRHHLLHRQGLPLFRPDFSYHYRPALSYQQLTHLPPDWVVVLAQRPSGKRSFSNAEEVKEAVLAAFPAERVVVFDGSLQLMQACVELFCLAGMFVGGQGAALSDLIFLNHPFLSTLSPPHCPQPPVFLLPPALVFLSSQRVPCFAAHGSLWNGTGRHSTSHSCLSPLPPSSPSPSSPTPSPSHPPPPHLVLPSSRFLSPTHFPSPPTPLLPHSRSL
ncbi:unnamed protein product [Closterium sp. NIES-64]|nr:unnamed protein product [Closterium sp. NIES-64]